MQKFKKNFIILNLIDYIFLLIFILNKLINYRNIQVKKVFIIFNFLIYASIDKTIF